MMALTVMPHVHLSFSWDSLALPITARTLHYAHPITTPLHTSARLTFSHIFTSSTHFAKHIFYNPLLLLFRFFPSFSCFCPLLPLVRSATKAITLRRPIDCRPPWRTATEWSLPTKTNGHWLTAHRISPVVRSTLKCQIWPRAPHISLLQVPPESTL
jgi:hypothetical protein